MVVGVFLAGCGGTAAESAADGTADVAADDAAPAAPAESDGGETTDEPASDEADDDPDELVPFGTVETVAGDQIDGGQYAGSNLALWFWAPW